MLVKNINWLKLIELSKENWKTKTKKIIEKNNKAHGKKLNHLGSKAKRPHRKVYVGKHGLFFIQLSKKP